jgi:threonine dehydrogenase-like Zn-dependent dehydrogenase
MSLTPAQRLLFASGPRITLEKYEIPAPGETQVLIRVAGFSAGQRVVCGSKHCSHWLADVGDPATVLEAVPDGVSDEAAGFSVLADVSLHCVRRARLQIDQSAAIFGMGLAGQMALQFARISGAFPLIAVDITVARLAKAKLGGATHTINASRENTTQRIREITQGAGADAVFHCTQVASILQSLLECAADRGTIILAGSAPGAAQIALQEDLLRREISIVGSYERGLPSAHPYWPWSRSRNRRACLRMMERGDLRIAPLITHRIKPAEAQGMFETMLAGNDSWLGIVIDWT